MYIILKLYFSASGVKDLHTMSRLTFHFNVKEVVSQYSLNSEMKGSLLSL